MTGVCLARRAGGTALQARPAAAEGEFTDRVGTLELDRELDARGNLGGMTIDRLGFLYVANFRDAVWRISPDGEVTELTRSLYGASGNAVDRRGDLYQANFFANTITRIARTGEVSLFADGLEGPVGLAFDAAGTLYVCNCSGNTLSRVTLEGEVEPFAKSDLFACPNGIVAGDDGNLYVTNFNNLDVLRVSPAGEVERFVDRARRRRQRPHRHRQGLLLRHQDHRQPGRQDRPRGRDHAARRHRSARPRRRPGPRGNLVPSQRHRRLAAGRPAVRQHHDWRVQPAGAPPG